MWLTMNIPSRMQVASLVKGFRYVEEAKIWAAEDKVEVLEEILRSPLNAFSY